MLLSKRCMQGRSAKAWFTIATTGCNLGSRQRSKRFADLRTIIERKLQLLDSASTLGDLASPPNNRLEALKGDGKGQHSIRVNDQYGLCFRWTSEGPEASNLSIITDP
jgi:proteic killer suppression protein